jgi:hypothetical protein
LPYREVIIEAADKMWEARGEAGTGDARQGKIASMVFGVGTRIVVGIDVDVDANANAGVGFYGRVQRDRYEEPEFRKNQLQGR